MSDGPDLLTKEENDRRLELIDLEFERILTNAEIDELELLQAKARHYRAQYAHLEDEDRAAYDLKGLEL